MSNKDRELKDLVATLEKKILGMESLLSFIVMGMEVLCTKDESYEVNALQTLHDLLMSIRKDDIVNLYKLIDSENDCMEK